MAEFVSGEIWPPGSRTWEILLPPAVSERFSVRFRLRVSLVPEDQTQPATGAREFLRQAPDPGSNPANWWGIEDRDEVLLWIPTFGLRVHLDLAREEAEVKLSGAQELRLVQCRNVLRVLYFYGFLKNQGLLLHASGLLQQAQAYVFPGVPDAGKTTVVRNSPGMAVLSDEVVAVQIGAAAESAMGIGTPFFGDWGQPGDNLTGPIRGLYFPIKDKATWLRPLSPKETLARLLPCIFSYTNFPERQEQLLELGSVLASKVPGFAFHFRPEPEMWRVINES